jgi:hypothetical protein
MTTIVFNNENVFSTCWNPHGNVKRLQKLTACPQAFFGRRRSRTTHSTSEADIAGYERGFIEAALSLNEGNVEMLLALVRLMRCLDGGISAIVPSVSTKFKIMTFD